MSLGNAQAEGLGVSANDDETVTLTSLWPLPWQVEGTLESLSTRGIAI